VVRTAVPAGLTGDEARSLVDLLAQAERAAASGIALLSPRVVETGAHTKAGHASAAEWLATVAGSSAGVAKGRLATAERAKADGELTQALHDGELSVAQLAVMGRAEAAAPGGARTLLGLASAGASHQELSAAAVRIGAAARSKESERARRVRVHNNRHFRWQQCPEGGIRGAFFCDEIEWARVCAGLEAQAKQRWQGPGAGTSLEAHRLDAFLAMLGGTTSSEKPTKARPHTIVVIDAEALRRGTASGGELCEIEGIGPVSVEAARELIGEGGLQFLVKDGVDVRTITSTTRHLPQRVAAALLVRDRTCVVPGCGKRRGLEVDHCGVDYGDNGPTEMANLAKLCADHHDLKTYGGFRLEGGPGAWKWITPAHPKSALYITRARRLEAARAKARRNDPQRT
jgi:hypothetical protein